MKLASIMTCNRVGRECADGEEIAAEESLNKRASSTYLSVVRDPKQRNTALNLRILPRDSMTSHKQVCVMLPHTADVLRMVRLPAAREILKTRVWVVGPGAGGDYSGEAIFSREQGLVITLIRG